jgi:radical SAM superfamily enzyme YgiQ (UPF0313 family)
MNLVTTPTSAAPAARPRRLLFVHPPQFHMAKMPGPEMVFKSSFYAPLGLLYVATYAQEHTDCEVRFFDYELGCTDVDDIVPLLQSYQPDVVGITGYTFAFYDTISVCRVVKEHLPECTVVMGGPHVDVYPEETFHHPEVDFLVRAEGEQTFVELLEHLQGQRAVEDVQGLY